MPQQASSRQLYPLFVVAFVATLGFSLVMPFLVTLVTRFGGNALVYGAMGATYSAFQLFAAPVLGRWSDSIGRRKVLLYCQLGTLASWIVFMVGMYLPDRTLRNVDSALLGSFVITLPLVVLFLARSLDGATGGDASVASAYLADLSEPDELQENFGRMAAASSLGLIIGPALGGLLASTAFGEVASVAAALMISVGAVLLIVFYLPDSKPVAPQEHHGHDHVRKSLGHGSSEATKLAESAQASWGEVLSLPAIGYLLTIQFIVFVAYSVFFTAFPVYVITVLSWDTHHVGYLFSFLGVATVIVQGPLLSFLAPRVSSTILMLSGSVVMAVGFVMFDGPNTLSIYAGAALFSLGNGMLFPSLTAMLARFAGADSQGAVQGVSGGVGSLGSIIGLLAGGALFHLLSDRIFILSAGLIGVVALLSLRFARTADGSTDALEPLP